MEKNVAELFRQLAFFAFHYGIAKFIHLLYGLGTERLVCLLPVPWTFDSQFIKHIQNAAERLKFFFSCMHIFCFRFLDFARNDIKSTRSDIKSTRSDIKSTRNGDKVYGMTLCKIKKKSYL